MINISPFKFLPTQKPKQTPSFMLLILLLCMFVCTLLSCTENNQVSGGGTHGGNPVEFSGLIMDESGNPQKSVEVSLIPEGQVPFSESAKFYQTSTNEKGEFTITVDGIEQYTSLNLSAVDAAHKAALFKRRISDGNSDSHVFLGENTLTPMGVLKLGALKTGALDISLPGSHAEQICDSYVYIEGSLFYKKIENQVSDVVFSGLAPGEYDIQLGQCSDVASFSLQIATSVIQSNDTLSISLQTVAGTKHYVSATGDDSGSGSQSNPWARIQHAVNRSSAGDTIVVESGIYNEFVQIENSGELFSPIVIQSPDSAKLQGFQVNANHVAIEGFQFEYLGGDSSEVGIIVNGNDILIQQNTFQDLPLWSVRAGSRSEYTQSLRVIGNKIQNGGAGFLLYGNYLLVQNNEFERLNYKSENPDAITFFGSNIRIENNLIWGSTREDVAGSETGITAFQTWDNNGEFARQILISNNRIHGVNSCFVFEGLFYKQNRDWLLRNNVCSDIWLYTGIVHDIYNARLYHNTFYQSEAQGIAFRGSGSNTEVLNNIFSHNEQAFTVDHSEFFSADYNLYHATSLTEWDDSHSFTGDPTFTDAQANDFSLMPGSEAIDKGQDTGVNTDLAGDSRPYGEQVDIGAYEYSP